VFHLSELLHYPQTLCHPVTYGRKQFNNKKCFQDDSYGIPVAQLISSPTSTTTSAPQPTTTTSYLPPQPSSTTSYTTPSPSPTTVTAVTTTSAISNFEDSNTQSTSAALYFPPSSEVSSVLDSNSPTYDGDKGPML
jgi:hypothetical protein